MTFVEQLESTPTTCDEPSVADLVIAARRGNRQAFGQLVHRYQRAVYLIVLRRLGSHSDAQEVVQEVFIQAMRKLGQLRDPRSFGGWIRSIANRMAINRAQRRAVAEVSSGEVEGCWIDGETPLGRILAREAADQLRDGLAQLGSLDRQTLVAFYFDGRTLVEMSRKFDSPVGTIKRRLHVARRRLAKQLASMAPA